MLDTACWSIFLFLLVEMKRNRLQRAGYIPLRLFILFYLCPVCHLLKDQKTRVALMELSTHRSSFGRNTIFVRV